MDDSIFDKKGGGTRTPSALSPLPIALGVVVLLLIGGLLWRVSVPAPQPLPPTSVPAAVLAPTPVPTSTPAPTPTPTPDCDSITTYLTVITDQEGQGRWDVAAQNIQTVLANKRLCTADQEVLESKYITDSLEALYARPFRPDKTSQEDALTAYQSIKETAARYSVDAPRAIVVAQRANQSGLFLVAKASYDEAYRDGSFQTSDMALVKDYVSTLFNTGSWWTKSSSDYDEGLTYLAASRLVAEKYQTGQAEAWGLLKQLLGNNTAIWPKPAATPLLS